MFDFKCCQCGDTISVGEELAGQLFDCPWCGTPNTVPVEPVDAPSEPPPPLPVEPVEPRPIERIERHLANISFWVQTYVIVSVLLGIMGLLAVYYANRHR